MTTSTAPENHTNGLGGDACYKWGIMSTCKTRRCPCHVVRRHCVNCMCLERCTNVGNYTGI